MATPIRRFAPPSPRKAGEGEMGESKPAANGTLPHRHALAPVQSTRKGNPRSSVEMDNEPQPKGSLADEGQIRIIAPQTSGASPVGRGPGRGSLCPRPGDQPDEQGRLQIPEPPERGQALRSMHAFPAPALVRGRAGQYQPEWLVQMVPRGKSRRVDGILESATSLIRPITLTPEVPGVAGPRRVWRNRLGAS